MLSEGLPFIPFLQSSEDILFFFYIFARIAGLFLVSPLLSNNFIPANIRTFLVLSTTLLLGMALYPDYRGDQARFVLQELSPGTELSLLMLTITLVKELTIGFLIGFAFTIIYEAILLAGQLIGVMIGFSIMQMLDPVSNTSRGIISQLLAILASLIIITLDMHHTFIRVTADSFAILPLGHYHLPYELLQTITAGTSRLFHYGLQFAAIPFVFMSLVTIGLGFMARVMPEMNIFMVGFPLKIFVGFYTLIFTVQYFPLVLRAAFVEYHNLANQIIHHIGLGS